MRNAEPQETEPENMEQEIFIVLMFMEQKAKCSLILYKIQLCVIKSGWHP